MSIHIITLFAFYVILIAVTVILLSEFSVLLFRASRAVGAIIGAIVGIVASVLLFIYVGKYMVAYN